MPKVIYGMGGVSADGYIVGPDGKFDRSRPDEELHRFDNEQTQRRRAATSNRSSPRMGSAEGLGRLTRLDRLAER